MLHIKAESIYFEFEALDIVFHNSLNILTMPHFSI